MIQPMKHMNLDTSLINCTAEVLEALSHNPSMPYTAVVAHLEKALGPNAHHQANSALSLLFLLGKLEYDLSNDLVFRVGVKP